MEKKNVILPRKNLVHDELLSDEMVSAFAFSSVGCHYMKKVDGNIEMKNSDMDNVCYVSDFGGVSNIKFVNHVKFMVLQHIFIQNINYYVYMYHI